MRFARFYLLFFFLLTTLDWPRQTQASRAQSQATAPPTTSSDTIPRPSTKDAQAVSVVTQALGIVGGIPAIKAIADYSGTGTRTYHLAQDVQGTVTIRGSGLGEFRLDASLPTGVRSESINGGITIKTEDGNVQQLHYLAPMNPSRLAPRYLLLSPALCGSGYNLLYKGIVQIDGQSALDVHLQRILLAPDPNGALAGYFDVDFFIDPSTFQIIMMRDQVGPNNRIRQFQYSDFKSLQRRSSPLARRARNSPGC